MQQKPRLQHFLFIAMMAMTLGACQFQPVKTETGFEVEPGETGKQIRPTADTSKAALSLLAKARAAAKEGKLEIAESNLERAIRIEPRNAVLWHYMAKLRLYQGRLDQAAGLAAKSNSLDRDDHDLQANNWRIIAHARHQQGDLSGARSAQQRVNDLSQ